MIGKTEDNRKKGRSKMKWIDSTKEIMAISLKDVSRDANDRLWRVIESALIVM